MADKPYALIVLPPTSDKTDKEQYSPMGSAGPAVVAEQKLGTCGDEGAHCGGTRLDKSVHVLVNEVVDGVRHVKVTRPLKGMTDDHYSFDMGKQPYMNVMGAIGYGPTFMHHKDHQRRQLVFLSTARDGTTTKQDSTCMCGEGGASSSSAMCDFEGQNCDRFVKQCASSCDGYEPGKGKDCGSLLEQKNPTCNSKQYAGGLNCCHHGRIMLDADQPDSKPGEMIRYRMKFRYWYEEYVPGVADPQTGVVTKKPSHFNLPRVYFQTESNAGEYDVPPAYPMKKGYPIPGYSDWPGRLQGKPTPGTTCTGTCPDGDDCECTHTILYKWDIWMRMWMFEAADARRLRQLTTLVDKQDPRKKETDYDTIVEEDPDVLAHDAETNTLIRLVKSNDPIRLMYAGGHCHAPSCISLELYRNDTGHEMELVCRQEAILGKGDYAKDKFDDPDYIHIPPCIWRGPEGASASNETYNEVLNPSIVLPSGTPMVSIKKNRNTNMGHYGDMASWHMRAVNF